MCPQGGAGASSPLLGPPRSSLEARPRGARECGLRSLRGRPASCSVRRHRCRASVGAEGAPDPWLLSGGAGAERAGSACSHLGGSSETRDGAKAPSSSRVSPADGDGEETPTCRTPRAGQGGVDRPGEFRVGRGPTGPSQVTGSDQLVELGPSHVLTELTLARMPPDLIIIKVPTVGNE